MDVAIDVLFGHLATHTPPAFFAEIIDELIWLIDDSEMDLRRILRGWLITDERRKVAVALAIRGMELLESDAERRPMFEWIVRRWPDLEPMCRTSLQLQTRGRAHESL